MMKDLTNISLSKQIIIGKHANEIHLIKNKNQIYLKRENAPEPFLWHIYDLTLIRVWL